MIQRQVATFLVVGSLTVVVDFLSYYGLARGLGIAVDPAKAVGFIIGTLFAYFANRWWTFGGQPHRPGTAWRFLGLYLGTLAANVAVNALLLRALHGTGWPLQLQIAFVVATGVSATLNFIGMKWFVFAPGAPEGRA